MNEILFLLQVLCVFSCTLFALCKGKEALVSWVCLQALFANFFVLKEVSIFGLQVTCSDAFAIGSVLGLNFLREYYGKNASKLAVKLCFFSLVFFAIAAKLHVLYTPSVSDSYHSAYEAILSPAPRLLFSSLLVFFLVQKADLFLFSRLRSTKKSLSLPVRTFLALLLSELLDTILFTYIGLYGIISSPFEVITFSFLLKGMIILLLTPSTFFAKRFYQETPA